MADSDTYVTNDSWVRTIARPDAIDDIADQFERRAAPVSPVVAPAASADREAHWPRRSRGWRSIARLHPQDSRASA